jgi:hypothetical protein
MRMFVILVILLFLLLLVAGIAKLAVDRHRGKLRRERKREAMATRLAAVVAKAEREHRAATEEAEASSALTTVLPVILAQERAPRHVA